MRETKNTIEKMKIIVAGAYTYPIYQESLCHGLESNGIDVIRLVLPSDRPYNILLAIQNGKLLLKTIKDTKPNVIFLYRVENIIPKYLKIIKKKYPKIIIFLYHNDDPYRKDLKRYVKSYNYLHCIKYSDITYVYRNVNIKEAEKYGAKKSKVLMSNYNSITDLANFSSSDFYSKNGRVVFLGHFENDDRVEYLDFLFKNNIDVHIYGPSNWINVFRAYGWPNEKYHEIVRGEEYRDTIHQSSIALCFLSTKNRDEYTRRCFEIPISGTVIAVKRTPITSLLFCNNNDSIIFSDKEDLLYRIKSLLADNQKLASMAFEGYNTIKNGGHSEIDRAKEIINDINTYI